MSVSLDGRTIEGYTREVLILAKMGEWEYNDTLKRSVIRSHCLLNKEVMLEVQIWMSRSPAKSGKATAMKSLKGEWERSIQSAREKGEKDIGVSSTICYV